MGTTCNRILFVISAIFFYSLASLANPVAVHAAPADSVVKGKGEKSLEAGSAAAGWSNPSRTPQGKTCAASFDSLEFVDQKFQGPAVCVDARNDSEAARECGGALFVNPANPDYKNNSGTGTANTNRDGYYYCVDYEQQNQKRYLCEVAAPRANSGAAVQLTYQYQVTGAYGDGVCVCSNGSTQQNCSAGTAEIAAASPQCTGPGIRPYTRVGTGSDEGTLCSCVNVSGAFPVAQAAERCAQAEREAAAAATAAVPPATIDSALDQCLNAWVETSNSCKAKADEAKTKCDEANSRNQNSNAAANITGSMGDMYAAANQASGTRAECFRAGVAANTGQQAIRSMQATCEADFANCNTACGTNRVEEFQQDCARRTNKTFEQLLNENAPGTPAGDALRTKVATIENNFSTGRETCTVQAQEKRSTLSNLLAGIGRALQSSVQCVCQVSSAGGDCGAIPPVQDCSQVPQPAGCGGYGAMNTCTPGSPGYNAKTCGCMQNPSQPGCSGGSNAISSFAGPGLANNLARGAAGAGGNFSGGAAGGRSSGISLGGNGRTEDGDLSFLGAGKAGGAAAANNSVGGGGAPGSASSSNGNATEDKGGIAADDGGIGGMFNQAKTFMSRTLGLGKKPTTTTKSNGAAGKPDMGKFKPLRGLAGRAGGMGSRNMDIWKMMNACTSGDTCKSNENNYLITP